MAVQNIGSSKQGQLFYDQVTSGESSGTVTKTGGGKKTSSAVNSKVGEAVTVGEGEVVSTSRKENERVTHSDTKSTKIGTAKGTSEKEGVSHKTGTTTSTTTRDLSSNSEVTGVSKERANLAFRVRFSVELESGGNTPDPSDTKSNC